MLTNKKIQTKQTNSQKETNFKSQQEIGNLSIPIRSKEIESIIKNTKRNLTPDVSLINCTLKEELMLIL